MVVWLCLLHSCEHNKPGHLDRVSVLSVLSVRKRCCERFRPELRGLLLPQRLPHQHHEPRAGRRRSGVVSREIVSPQPLGHGDISFLSFPSPVPCDAKMPPSAWSSRWQWPPPPPPVALTLTGSISGPYVGRSLCQPRSPPMMSTGPDGDVAAVHIVLPVMDGATKTGGNDASGHRVPHCCFSKKVKWRTHK